IVLNWSGSFRNSPKFATLRRWLRKKPVIGAFHKAIKKHPPFRESAFLLSHVGAESQAEIVPQPDFQISLHAVARPVVERPIQPFSPVEFPWPIERHQKAGLSRPDF